MPGVIETRLTRHHPIIGDSLCGCVVELEADFDMHLVPGMRITEPRFCLMSNICDRHSAIASTTFRSNHADLSKHILDLIEVAKTANLRQVDEQIVRAQQMKRGRARALYDLQLSRANVVQFNAKLDDEWKELVSFPDAFDEHIHEQIKKEQAAVVTSRYVGR